VVGDPCLGVGDVAEPLFEGVTVDAARRKERVS